MKTVITILSLLFLGIHLQGHAQTLIATSKSPDATANHNQRKIVRDDNHSIHIFYQDVVNNSNAVMYIRFDSVSSSWSQPEFITQGSNPAVAISQFDTIYLAFQSNETNSRIILLKRDPAGLWSDAVLVSNNNDVPNILPVADVGYDEKVWVTWIEKGQSQDRALVYQSGEIKVLYEGGGIDDVSVATALLYNNWSAYFAIHLEEGRVHFFRAEEFIFFYPELFLDTMVVFPSQSINVESPGISYFFTIPRWLYINPAGDICMASLLEQSSFELTGPSLVVQGEATSLTVDDIISPIGYSFLYIKNQNLYHAFCKFGFSNEYFTIYPIDEITSSPFNPSIAYKHFSACFVDFIWMEQNGDEYNILYKRSNKIPYIVASEEQEAGGGELKLTGSPNPFTDQIILRVVPDNSEIPVVRIFDLTGRVLTTLSSIRQTESGFEYSWDGKETSGNSAAAGTYILNVNAGKSVTNRLIIKSE